MSGIDPAWVEAGAHNICGIAPGKCPNWDEHLEQATHILAAVAPLIRAQVAAEIEAAGAPYAAQPYPNTEQAHAYRRAARIARGKP